MNDYISKFLEKICDQIKFKGIHEDIKIELMDHINEVKYEYLNEGMSEIEAEKKALEQMGDPFEIGVNLNKTHSPKTEWSIVVLIGMVVMIGAGTLFSISSDAAFTGSAEGMIRTYLIYISLGIIGCIGCFFFDYTKIEKYSPHIFILALLAMFMSNWFGVRINGQSYLRLAGWGINPSSLALPLFFISFPGLLTKWVNEDSKDIMKLFALTGLAIFSCLIQPSLSNAMVIGFGFVIMFIVAIMNNSFKGDRKRVFQWLFSLIIAGITMILISLSPYQMKRLFSFLTNKNDPLGAGYINMIIEKLLSGAKLLGRGEGLYINKQGLGEGFVLPMINSELILTYIISAFGWFAGIGLVCLLSLSIARMVYATHRINTIYGKYLSSSLVAFFALNVVLNILMNLGLSPITGLALPIVSYGGINFVMNMMMIGLMLGVYRRKDLVLRDGKAVE